MKRYIITALIAGSLLASCYEDKGNYDYRAINEVEITGVASSYTVPMDVGSLEIDPVVGMSMAQPDDQRFEYLWIVTDVAGDVVVDTICRTRRIDWQATLSVGSYSLYFKVCDKTAGLVDQTKMGLNIVAYHSRGIMLTGQDAQGNSLAQMIVMLQGQPEVFYDNILQYSEIPTLHGPISFQHSGIPYGAANKRMIWILTESGSYFLNNLTLKAEENFCTLDDMFPYDPGKRIDPIEVAPVVNRADGYSSFGGAGSWGGSNARYYLCSDGDLYGASMMSGDFFDSPLNIMEGQRIAATGPMLYAQASAGFYGCVLWYDEAGERFLKQGDPYTVLNAVPLVDNPADPFPFNQNGRTYVYGDNTRMTDQSASGGNSFAVMRETTDDASRDYDYSIYKMYVNNNNSAGTVVKQGFFTVKKSEAPQFGESKTYTFSSVRSVVFYIAGGKLMAYDYNPVANRNYEIAIADNNEVTMVKYDRQREPGNDYIYVATYSAATGGTLYKYRLDADNNTVKLSATPLETWTGLARITNMSWRGGE